MRAMDYKGRLRDTITEREIANKLRSLPEEERLTFILEMIDVNVAVAQELANNCLRQHDLLVRFLEAGIARVRDLSNIKYWMEAMFPRLGYRGVISVLRKDLDKHPFAVGSAVYFLMGYLKKGDPRSLRAFLDLWEAVKDKEGALVPGQRPDLEDAIDKLVRSQ